MSNNKPSFSTLLLDNAKTAAEIGGVAVGVPVGFISAGVFSIAFSCVFFGCGIPSDEEVKMGSGAGSIIGIAAAAVGGAITAFFLTLPLAIIAQKTRNFEKCKEIAPSTLAEITDRNTQIKLIQAIIGHDSKRPFLSGWHSYASSNLLRTLRGNQWWKPNAANKQQLTHEEKWAAVCAYMNDKTKNGVFRNNGKETFNMILEFVNKLPKTTQTPTPTPSHSA